MCIRLPLLFDRLDVFQESVCDALPVLRLLSVSVRSSSSFLHIYPVRRSGKVPQHFGQG